MQTIRFMRADELVDAGTTIDSSPFLGEWHNVNVDTDAIARVHITSRETGIMMQVFGTGIEGVIDWGITSAHTYGTIHARTAAGLTAHFSLGTVQVSIAANVKLGVLVKILGAWVISPVLSMLLAFLVYTVLGWILRDARAMRWSNVRPWGVSRISRSSSESVERITQARISARS